MTVDPDYLLYAGDYTNTVMYVFVHIADVCISYYI